MKIKFFNKYYVFLRPKLIPFLSFSVALTILVSLSTWQFKRLEWKNKLIDERVSRFESNPIGLGKLLNPSKHEFQRVEIFGKLLNQHELFMPALSKRGNNGYHILTILETDNNNIIYDTGWIPLSKKDKEKRTENLFREAKNFNAVIRLPGRKGKFQPDNDIDGNFWFFVDTNAIENFTNVKIEKNFYLEAAENGPNGSPLGKQTRIYLRNNHLQYALTWMMIALGLIGVFLAAHIKKVKK
tara:strand:+ start:1231 stop:1953 length:723 start_codon:yes stop_codon:yes gene_type:complete